MFSFRKQFLFLLVLAALFAPALGSVLAAPEFPRLSGRIVDMAGLLSTTQKTELTARLKALEEKKTDQLVIVTLKSLQGYEIRDYGYQLGRHWGIGQKDKNNGVLLIIAPNERKVAIEVGYGLEGVLTDALTKIIIENVILPKFRTKNMAGGIIAGANDIITVLEGNAEAVTAKKELAPAKAEEAPFWFIFSFVMFLFIAFFSITALGGGGSGSGSGRSSGSSGGWSGGGGFSGGGGSFGGGGSSGGW